MKANRSILPVMAGVAVAFIFGFSFLVTKGSLTQMAPLELLAHRFTMAAILLLVLLGLRVMRIHFSWRMVSDLLPLALFQPVIYFVGETVGVKLTSASESALVISLIPVAVAVMGSLFLSEPIRLKQWGFILLSIAGVVVIIITGAKGDLGFHILGFLTLLMAVIAAACYNILSRRFSRKYTPEEITTVMMITGAVFFNAARLISLSGKTLYFSAFTKISTLGPLFYLGVLSSVIAFFLVNYMLNKMKAAKVATFINLTTVVSVAAGVVFRGETFGFMQFIGSLMILGGVWGVTYTDENS